MLAKIPTPELDKMHLVHKDSQEIGEFLDWLRSKGFVLAKYHEHTDACFSQDGDDDPVCGYSRDLLYPDPIGFEQLLANYYGIDLHKVEEERRALLEAIRRSAGSS